jgi:hypothetical protein
VFITSGVALVEAISATTALLGAISWSSSMMVIFSVVISGFNEFIPKQSASPSAMAAARSASSTVTVFLNSPP